MRTLTAVAVFTLVVAACSSKTAATANDAASAADASPDATPCGPLGAHFPELDDHCAAIAGCTVFKATMPTCQPGAAKACTCGMCNGKQCVEQNCVDCADTTGTPDAPVADTDAVSQPVDVTQDTSVTETLPDISLLPKQQASSFQACLCWKQGDDCNLQGGPYLPKDPSKLCPADEVCDGDASHKYPDGNVAGQCHKLCALAGVGVAGTQDCAATEKCEARAIISGFEGATIVTVALCVPAQGAIGTDQTDAGLVVDK